MKISSLNAASVLTGDLPFYMFRCLGTTSVIDVIWGLFQAPASYHIVT